MDANTELTNQSLADVLNAAEGTSFHPWNATHILVGGVKTYIDRDLSDALASRLGHESRNESESRWMVVTDADETIRLEAEYIDGRGWVPTGS